MRKALLTLSCVLLLTACDKDDKVKDELPTEQEEAEVKHIFKTNNFRIEGEVLEIKGIEILVKVNKEIKTDGLNEKLTEKIWFTYTNEDITNIEIGNKVLVQFDFLSGFNPDYSLADYITVIK